MGALNESNFSYFFLLFSWSSSNRNRTLSKAKAGYNILTVTIHH